MNQKALMIGSLLLSSGAGFVCYPVMARNFPDQVMGGVSIVMLLGVFFGVFDVISPVLTRELSRANREGMAVSLEPSLFLSLKVGVLLSFLFFISFSFAFKKYFGYLSLAILAASVLPFCISLVFKSVLDSAGRVGSSQFTKSAVLAGFYIFCAIFSFSNIDILIMVIVFFFFQLFMIAVLFLMSRKCQFAKGQSLLFLSKKDLWNTMGMNVAKVFIDFPDRFLFAKLFPAQMFSAYAMIYDVSSRSNSLPQYINSYMYPRLCAQLPFADFELSKDIKKMILWSFLNFLLLSLAGFLVFPFSEKLVNIYLGEGYEGYGHLLPILLIVAGAYSTAFYGQAIFRSMGRFYELLVMFWTSATFGMVVVLLSFYLWGANAAVMGIIVLKSPGLGVILYLSERNFGAVRVSMALLFIIMTISFVYIKIFGVFATTFCLSALLFVSAGNYIFLYYRNRLYRDAV